MTDYPNLVTPEERYVGSMMGLAMYDDAEAKFQQE